MDGSMRSRIMWSRSVLLCALTACVAACTSDPVHRVGARPAVEAEGPRPWTGPLNDLLDSLGLAVDDLSLHVDKSERRLCVRHGEDILRCYPVVLGGSPEGDKRMQGDQRTPEGRFTFRDKYPHGKWHRFAWIDYPNAESRERFNERRASREIPADARIGGEVGIHGVPEGMDLLITTGVDWTLGCIAMRNTDLDEVYEVIVPERTIVEIVP